MSWIPGQCSLADARERHANPQSQLDAGSSLHVRLTEATAREVQKGRAGRSARPSLGLRASWKLARQGYTQRSGLVQAMLALRYERAKRPNSGDRSSEGDHTQ